MAIARLLWPISVSVLISGLLVPGAASAGGLFEPATLEELAMARRSAPATIASFARQSFARLNRSQLAAHMAALDGDRASDRARQARRLDGRVDMVLGAGVAVTLRRTEVDRVRGGGVLWTGDVLGGDGATGSFLVEHGQITGIVDLGDRIFKIEPIDGDLHRIVEADPSQMRDDIVVAAPAEPEGVAPEVPAAGLAKPQAKRRTKIKYLVAYTSKAKNASTNIGQAIKFAIAWSNQALKKSGAKIVFKLVKTMLVKNYDEDSVSYSQGLTDLRTGPKFRKVRKRRDRRALRDLAQTQ